MTNKALISPAFEKGHFDGLVDEGKYLRQSSLYKQILPRTQSRPKTSMISASKNLCNLWLIFCAFLWLIKPRNLFTPLETCLLFLMGRNPRFINDLRLPPPVRRRYLCAYKALYNCRDSFTDVMSTLQNHLFMQNKAKFQKVKLNVTKVLTRDYGQLDTWSIRKNEPKTNPNEPKTNPIFADKTPIRTQTNPIQTQTNPISEEKNAVVFGDWPFYLKL
jgi:hypothetical protein